MGEAVQTGGIIDAGQDIGVAYAAVSALPWLGCAPGIPSVEFVGQRCPPDIQAHRL